MKAGTLRHVAVYQEAIDVADANGQEIKEWSDVATYRAEARALSGREALLVDQSTAVLTTVVTHRFVGESAEGRPRPNGRYLIGARVLNIVSVFDPTGERRELRAFCAEDAA